MQKREPWTILKKISTRNYFKTFLIHQGYETPQISNNIYSCFEFLFILNKRIWKIWYLCIIQWAKIRFGIPRYIKSWIYVLRKMHHIIWYFVLQSPYFDNCHKDSNLMQHKHWATEHTTLKYTISTAFTIFVLLRIFLHLRISKLLNAVKTVSPGENSFDLKVTCVSTAELI